MRVLVVAREIFRAAQIIKLIARQPIVMLVQSRPFLHAVETTLYPSGNVIVTECRITMVSERPVGVIGPILWGVAFYNSGRKKRPRTDDYGYRCKRKGQNCSGISIVGCMLAASNIPRIIFIRHDQMEFLVTTPGTKCQAEHGITLCNRLRTYMTAVGAP